MLFNERNFVGGFEGRQLEMEFDAGEGGQDAADLVGVAEEEVLR